MMSITSRNPASAYQERMVQTANGPRLLVMLCDRLAVDVVRAEVALEANDLKTVNESLQHAQKIVRVLRSALDPDGFKGGHELLSVYVFLENHLVKANLEKSASVISECANLIAPIRDAWSKAVQSEGE
jgi:flagellar secretion chaperone FliS